MNFAYYRPFARARTNKYGAAFAFVLETAFAIHDFSPESSLYSGAYANFTGSDCEGAGEMFRVTNAFAPGEKNVSEDFQPRLQPDSFRTVQLRPWLWDLDAFTAFGPTFRAENSNTPRHAAEFWMVETEAAFIGLDDLMDLGEGLVRHVVRHVLDRCQE